MPLYARKRIEVIIEAPAAALVVDLFNQHQVKGFTVVTASGGRGQHSAWDLSPVTDAQQQVIVIAILGEERAAKLVEAVGALLEDYRGIVTLSAVEVLRPARF